MRAIDRKMLRDLSHLRGQAIAIILVMASGVALFVSQLSMLDSLKGTRADYYRSQRFADVFVDCKRAPLSVAERLREVPGVARVETRISLDVTLDIPGMPEPAAARLLSVPDGRQPALNALFFRSGALPAAPDECVITENFAKAHGFGPGSRITALINGRRRELAVVGVVLSPEYVYALGAGALIPDNKRFGVFWLRESDLAAAYDMEGAFNSATLQLAPGANERAVRAGVDRVLAQYGGLGAVPRAEQTSHWYLQNELNQLESFGTTLPLIFLGVAAFLLNVVLSRLISTQRDQVAALKAFGYTNLQVATHYLKMVLLLSLIGAAIGTGLGAWLGSQLTLVYTEFYNFPELRFRLPLQVPLMAVAVTAGAAVLGTVWSLRRAAKLPPAEAMRPEAPPRYRPTLIERIGLQRFLSQPARMILRQLERRPLKAAASVLGISMGVAILVVGMSFLDMINHVISLQANHLQREDVSVTFVLPRGRGALHELKSLDGVLHAQPWRSVPARLRHGHRSRLAGVTGVDPSGTLNRVLDEDLQPVSLPRDGVAMSRVLADVLGLRSGDMLTLEVLEGSRPTRQVRVVALIDDFLGMAAYMDLASLNALMQEDGVISGAYLRVDPDREADVFRRLKATPAVGSVAVKDAVIGNLRQMVAENMMISLMFSVGFACVIAFGVVYNAARISLSERARELASLRVLGLTRGEISFILLGELAVLVLLALPFGCALGWLMARGTLATLNSEILRLPFVVTPFTYAFSSGVVLLAAALSALAVRNRLDHLDLVEVLKTRE
jgi:putative ABC transport system permease protein